MDPNENDSFVHTPTINTTAAPIYNFYDIDKSFDSYNNVIVAEGQRVIPIYVCRPICRYVKEKKPSIIEVRVEKEPDTAAVKSVDEEILKELRKIDEMQIELIKAPPTRNQLKQTRKSKLEVREHLSEGFLRIRNSNISLMPIARRREIDEVEDIPKEKPQIDLPQTPSLTFPCAVVQKVESVTPEMITPSAIPSDGQESPEKEPQFSCCKCGQKFYLKRAMLRHLYSHK